MSISARKAQAKRKAALEAIRTPQRQVPKEGDLVLVRHGLGSQVAEVLAVDHANGNVLRVRCWSQRSSRFMSAKTIGLRDLAGSPGTEDARRIAASAARTGEVLDGDIPPAFRAPVIEAPTKRAWDDWKR